MKPLSRRELLATVGLGAPAVHALPWRASAAAGASTVRRPAWLWIAPKLGALPARPQRSDLGGIEFTRPRVAISEVVCRELAG